MVKRGIFAGKRHSTVNIFEGPNRNKPTANQNGVLGERDFDGAKHFVGLSPQNVFPKFFVGPTECLQNVFVGPWLPQKVLCENILWSPFGTTIWFRQKHFVGAIATTI